MSLLPRESSSKVCVCLYKILIDFKLIFNEK